MNLQVGKNTRFRDEYLYVAQELNTQGFGQGAEGRQKAIDAALANEGSELIYQNAKGWFARELGESETPNGKLQALSRIDRAKISLLDEVNAYHDMHDAFISFKDDRPAHVLPENIADMSAWQKLKTGNHMVLKNIAHQTTVALSHPVSATADFATGMASHSWNTLTNPLGTLESVNKTYREDKIEGVLAGVKAVGSVAASAALVVGATTAVANLGMKAQTLNLGMKAESAMVAKNYEEVAKYIFKAQNLARPAAHIAQVGVVAGKVGKVAGVTLIGATGLSLLKNEVDLAQAQNQTEMAKEVQAITQDAGMLARSAVFYAANRLLSKVAERARSMYHENRNYREISPEFKAEMDAFIQSKSQRIAERVTQEVKNFRPEVWEHLADADKISALQDVNRIFAEEMGFKGPSLNIEDMEPQSYGFYRGDLHSTTINLKHIGDIYETGNTVTHEAYHGYQKVMIEALLAEQLEPGSYLAEHAFSWVDNKLTGYASPQGDLTLKAGNQVLISDFVMREIFPGFDTFNEYQSQPLEATAWQMGDAFEGAFRGLVEGQ